MEQEKLQSVLTSVSRVATRQHLEIKALYVGCAHSGDHELPTLIGIYQSTAAEALVSQGTSMVVSHLTAAGYRLALQGSVEVLRKLASGEDLSILLPGRLFHGRRYMDSIAEAVNRSLNKETIAAVAWDGLQDHHGAMDSPFYRMTGGWARNALLAEMVWQIGRVPNQDEQMRWMSRHGSNDHVAWASKAFREGSFNGASGTARIREIAKAWGPPWGAHCPNKTLLAGNMKDLMARLLDVDQSPPEIGFPKSMTTLRNEGHLPDGTFMAPWMKPTVAVKTSEFRL